MNHKDYEPQQKLCFPSWKIKQNIDIYE